MLSNETKKLVKNFMKNDAHFVSALSYIEHRIDKKFKPALDALFEVYLYEKNGKNKKSSFIKFVTKHPF